MKYFLYLKDRSTDIQGIELEERNCACGCGLSFKVNKQSKQKYRSDDCVRLKKLIKREAKYIWARQSDYMVRG